MNRSYEDTYHRFRLPECGRASDQYRCVNSVSRSYGVSNRNHAADLVPTSKDPDFQNRILSARMRSPLTIDYHKRRCIYANKTCDVIVTQRRKKL